jgi:hypothetical protein
MSQNSTSVAGASRAPAARHAHPSRAFPCSRSAAQLCKQSADDDASRSCFTQPPPACVQTTQRAPSAPAAHRRCREQACKDTAEQPGNSAAEVKRPLADARRSSPAPGAERQLRTALQPRLASSSGIGRSIVTARGMLASTAMASAVAAPPANAATATSGAGGGAAMPAQALAAHAVSASDSSWLAQGHAMVQEVASIASEAGVDTGALPEWTLDQIAGMVFAVRLSQNAGPEQLCSAALLTALTSL